LFWQNSAEPLEAAAMDKGGWGRSSGQSGSGNHAVDLQSPNLGIEQQQHYARPA
jgi:hypothetical protein